jgi:hypothetical protein
MSHLAKSSALALAILVAGSSAVLAGKVTTPTTTQPTGQQLAAAVALATGVRASPNAPGPADSPYVNALIDALRGNQ